MSSKRISDITTADCNEIMRQLIDGKNDREAAILAGAFLESLLFDILNATLVDSIFQRSSKLFEYPRPLSSFGGMLSLAYAFGRISDDEFVFIRIVKRVRDLAAHSLTIRDGEQFAFSAEPIREILRDFYPTEIRKHVPKEAREQVENSYEMFLDFDARVAFRLTFSCAVMSLLGRQVLAMPLSPPPEINKEGSEHTPQQPI